MTWIRFDDNTRNHPKVEPLDDATYRLWREAIEWSGQNLTDGVILTRQLGLTSTRASGARARKLVDARLWHPAGERCGHEKCPPSGEDGWVIHDYWDYNPTAESAREEQAKARERKRKWLERRKNGEKNAVPNGVPDGVPDAGKNGNPAPPRPAPTPTGWGGPTAHSAGPPPEADGAAAGGEAEELTPVAADTTPDDGFGLVDEQAIAARIAADREASQRIAAEHEATTQRGLAAVRAALRRPA